LAYNENTPEKRLRFIGIRGGGKSNRDYLLSGSVFTCWHETR